VPERRDLGQERGRDRLRGGQPVQQGRPLRVDQRLDRLEACVETRRDEVLALADEEAELPARAPRREPAHELEAGVRRRGDHPSHSSQAPW
jgi:hypothetical protein